MLCFDRSRKKLTAPGYFIPRLDALHGDICTSTDRQRSLSEVDHMASDRVLCIPTHFPLRARPSSQLSLKAKCTIIDI